MIGQFRLESLGHFYWNIQLALNKAQELMLQYSISELELKNPFAKETCKVLQVPKIKIGYDIRDFYSFLAELFDCETYYNKNHITFFGFEQDTQMCEYFYKFIIQTLKIEIEKYKYSEDYSKIKRGYHGRTILSNFAKGFVFSLNINMQELIRRKEETLNDFSTQRGLIITPKKDKVEMEFQKLNLKFKIVKTPIQQIQKNAFDAGKLKGNKVKFNKPIAQKTTHVI